MATKRVNTDMRQDTSSINSLKFNKYAGGDKVLNIGPSLNILGPLNVAVGVPQGAALWIYNNSGTVAYAAFGGPSVVAPSSPANGIPLPPNSYTYLSAGENTFVIASAATVFGYQVIDDTILTIATT